MPVYPCSLPGGLIGGLRVHLRALSIEQVRDCFMAIERGGREAEPVRGVVLARGPAVLTPCTIGWFYDDAHGRSYVLNRVRHLTHVIQNSSNSVNRCASSTS